MSKGDLVYVDRPMLKEGKINGYRAISAAYI